jgi:hypothetical protein
MWPMLRRLRQIDPCQDARRALPEDAERPMSRWETTSTLEATVPPAVVWERAYADADAWPKWNAEIKRASLDGGGNRLVNTIYIDGALAPLWRRIMGPAAARTLPEAQRAVVALATA